MKLQAVGPHQTAWRHLSHPRIVVPPRPGAVIMCCRDSQPEGGNSSSEESWSNSNSLGVKQARLERLLGADSAERTPLPQSSAAAHTLAFPNPRVDWSRWVNNKAGGYRTQRV